MFLGTWTDDDGFIKYSNFQLQGYDFVHQIGKSGIGGWIAIFIKDSLFYKQRDDFSFNIEAVESLSIELLHSIINIF